MISLFMKRRMYPKLNLPFYKVFFCAVFFSVFLFFFITPSFVFADVSCDGIGESCGGACATGYTNIGFCSKGAGLFGAKLICCKEGAPNTTPTIAPDRGGSTTPDTSAPSTTPSAPTPSTPSASSPTSPATTTPSANPAPSTPSTTPSTATPPSAPASTPTISGSSGGLVPCTDDCTLCHLVLGIKGIFDFLLKLLLATCLLGITISGVLYMVSAGSSSLIEKAKKAFTYSITALVLLLCSWLIVNAVLNALGFKQAGSWSSFTCDTTQTVAPAIVGGGAGAGGGAGGGAGAGGAGAGTGSGGRPVGTGMVTSGEKTLDQVGQSLQAVTVYTDCNKNPCGWRDGKLYTDCSGFAQEFYKQAYGIDPGRSTVDMRKNANGSTDIGSIKTGSLVIMKGGGANGMHAGIFMDTDQNMIINNTGVGKNVVYYPVKQDRILSVIKAP